MAGLGAYLDKRDFGATPEPSADGTPSRLGLRYSMQNHDATRLHWDLRLEWDGVLLSWAVTRGPSLDPAEKRLAVRTEDHPLSYLTFEGQIPKGHYGAGTVMLWDLGWWQPLDPAARGLAKGHLKFRLHGQRMTGDWNLIRMKGKASEAKRENWLLVKIDDEAAHQRDPVALYKTSVSSRRSFAAIKADKPAALKDHPGTRPRHQPVQLATLTEDLADAATHWHELKLDGYRAQVALGAGAPRIFTRAGHDWTDRFADLLPALRGVPCKSALLDGEVVAGAGLQGFGTLQEAIKAGGPFRYVAFDLLHRDGQDLTALPLAARRKALERLFRPLPPMGALTLSPIIHGAADEALAMICGAGGEGVIAKRTDAPYRGGRSRDWLKIKCRRQGEFRIVGWQKSTSRGRPFASLALAKQRDDGLVYVGKVGTGFDDETMADLARRMAPLARKTPPVDAPRREVAGVTWIEPELVAKVDYAETTAQGRLRHAVFLDLRSVTPRPRQAPPPSAEQDRPNFAGISISSGNRVIFDKPRLTKEGLAEYYLAAAPLMLPHLANRPLSLLRLPEGMTGERFFQKHPGKGFPDALKVQDIEDAEGAATPYAYVTDAAGIIGAVQMGTVEFHIWGARRDRLDRPDRVVFDLDPDEGLSFAATRRAALDLRDRLADLGLASWAMLSGGKGIHIIVPLRRTAGWDTVKLFSKGVAMWVAGSQPERFTAEMSKAKRKGRIFIDWLRNERGATAIAPFSVRARPGAPVACPISWDELPRIRKASAFSTRQALARGWADVVPPPPQGLTAPVIEALDRALSSGS
ncbi:DNA ligase D [Paracoccus hibiscisoli]|uniref:DNA ligase (ATP) n=1 Tax=Paracoccus hibiscisoli TaxID=2023261 RepID=A0A4U0QGE2_9RHOB|nr:DNA ligase D [Paracoccus hibiscisoli]TJZ79872.1 DNA ligase D [Paracoccus hibiscisoli]